MDDLGEPQEPAVDYFRCVQQDMHNVGTPLTRPSVHSNLIAATSRYGYVFVATADTVLVHSLSALRAKQATPLHTVTLTLGSGQSVRAVRSVALVHRDTTLVIHVNTQQGDVALVANVSALVSGRLLLHDSPPFSQSPLTIAQPPQQATTIQQTALLAAILPGSLVELTSLKHDLSYSTITKLTVSSQPSCLAISSEQDIVAIGTERGSVVLHSPDGSLLGTVVEVESGWRPFYISFISKYELFVSYICNEDIRHVIWKLSGTGNISVKGHSALGELCFSSPELDDDETTSTPVVTVHMIDSWSIAVVSSSFSTDIEIIHRTEDGEWENWKCGEGKAAVLPTDDDDQDTKPLGVAIDYSDTRPVDALDAADSKRKPMPKLIVLTSHGYLLPFLLVDDRPDVFCESVQDPVPLPPVPVERKGSSVTAGVGADKFSFSGNGSSLFGDGKVSVKTTEAKPPRQLQPLTLNLFGKPPLPTTSAQSNRTHFAEPPITTVSNSTSDPGRNTSARNLIPATAQPTPSHPSRPGNQLLSGHQASPTLPMVQESQTVLPLVSGTDAPLDANLGTSLPSTSPKEHSFTGTDAFLSQFSYPPPQAIKKEQEFESKPAERKVQHATGIVSSTLQSVQMQSATSITSLSNTKVEASLTSATGAVAEGHTANLLESMMIEMTEEMNATKSAERIMTKEVRLRDKEIMRTVDFIRSDLRQLLDVVTRKFQSESGLRNVVSQTLKTILALSREYETLSLELSVREEEGFSRTLATEAREMDEQLAKKETNLLKAIASIEEKLNSENALRDRSNGSRWNNSMELIQQVYSSLSLQGIRIRKVQGLLAALNDRVEQQDKGGRRSDLGLSLARLEKLSLSDRRRNEDAQDSDRPCPPGSSRSPKITQNVSSSPARHDGDATQGLPNDIKEVLRRVAMRNGRAEICVSRHTSARYSTIQRGSFASHSEKRLNLESSMGHSTISKLQRPDTQAAPSGLVGINEFSLADVKIRRNAGSSDTYGVPQQLSVKKTSNDQSEVAAPPLPKASSGGVKQTSFNMSFLSQELSQSGIRRERETASIPDDSDGLGNNRRGREHSGLTDSKKTRSPFDAQPTFATAKQTSVPDMGKPDDSTPQERTTVFSSLTSKAKPVAGGRYSSNATTPAGRNLSSSPAKDTPTFASLPPDETQTFASLPPDTTPTFAALSPNNAPPVALLPPDDSPVASLPPDDIPVASLPPEDTPTFASLPPDTPGTTPSLFGKGSTTKSSAPTFSLSASSLEGKTKTSSKSSAEFASLPPTDSSDRDKRVDPKPPSEPGLFASLPPSEETPFGKSSKEHSSGETTRDSNTAKDEPASGNNFAALPPDDGFEVKNKAPASFGFGSSASFDFKGFGSTAEVNAPSTSSMTQSSEASSKPSLATQTPTIFSSPSTMEASGALSSGAAAAPVLAQTNQGSTSLFGSNPEFGAPQSSNSLFGSAQTGNAFGAARMEKAISIDGSSSDDSDKEANTKPIMGFGAFQSGASQQSLFGAASPSSSNTASIFGNQAAAEQPKDGSSMFGNQNSNPFSSSASLSQPFGAGSMDAAPATGFGAAASGPASFASGFGNASFSSSGQSFDSAPAFGMSSQLGAPAAPVFGAAAPTPTFGVSTFGSSGMNQGQGQAAPMSTFGSPSGFGVPSAAVSNAQFGVTNTSFGGSSTGGSGFAALASSSGNIFGQASSNSGFASLANAPAFGDSAAPPAFTSPAFTQRRDV